MKKTSKPKKLSSGAMRRNQEITKDLAKAEKRRELQKEKASISSEAFVKNSRAFKKKLKKMTSVEQEFSMFSVVKNPNKIRKNEVTIDQHTTIKKEPMLYKLEGDTGWLS